MVGRIPEEMRSAQADAEVVMNRCGAVALDHIKRAFEVKSHGGTDEAGDSWQPLSPKTVAYKAARTKLEKARDKRPSQALTNKQQERWWSLYRQGLAMFKGDKAQAARRAWFFLKREGATTLLDKYGGARVRILYDSGELLNSLTSGIRDGYITISTARKGAAAHHYGTTRIPQRRLWPDPNRWPSRWWQDIANALRDGLVEMIKEDLRGGLES